MCNYMCNYLNVVQAEGQDCALFGCMDLEGAITRYTLTVKHSGIVLNKFKVNLFLANVPCQNIKYLVL